MFEFRFLKILGVVCFSLVVLAGCRPEEQGRPLNYEPGVYPGKLPGSSLSEEDLAQLRQRSILQGGQQADIGGGGPTRGSDVRQPAEASDAIKALQDRGKYQGGN
jgi:hypothetical protein